ncbi:MAG: chloride channel protein [Betaproteobacteria bacterium]|nr:MAG: chloride channel protein [Betaproteobacteria bacterium]
MRPNSKSKWLAQSARLSRFMADRGMIVSVIYAFSLLVGFLAVGFAWMSDFAGEWNKELFAEHMWVALLLPPIVFPIALWLVNTIFWGAGGSGIPQAIKVTKHPKPRLMERLLGPRAFLGKLLITPFVIAAGAAAGREGPTVQIGAALMAYAGRFPNIAKLFDTRSLIIAGGAAGVAAAFNTPLGGLMFAFEELGRRKTMRHTSALLMAIVLAGLVALILQGNYSYFGYSNATIDWGQEWLIIFTLAILTGIVGGLYGRSMLILVSSTSFLGGLRSRFPYRFAAGCGVVLSLMALVFGAEVFGAGYEETKAALQDSEELSPMFWLTKMVATVVSFASGIPGGVFSPTLSIGAGFGLFFAGLTNSETAPLMLLAMVGVLSAVTHCPITAFVIVLEMVDNHDLVMPLIFVSAISTQVSKRILPASIYHLLANQIKVSFAQTEPTPAPESASEAKPAETSGLDDKK